tara:strand:- start:18 stop:209 length:192 start_codon:yes stop_codon:yes gene_type:complete
MNEIKKPTKPTWFICLENKVVKAYGKVETNQTMTTKWSVVKSYTSKISWSFALLAKGIIVNDI